MPASSSNNIGPADRTLATLTLRYKVTLFEPMNRLDVQLPARLGSIKLAVVISQSEEQITGKASQKVTFFVLAFR
jgi:hypothetical protein